MLPLLFWEFASENGGFVPCFSACLRGGLGAEMVMAEGESECGWNVCYFGIEITSAGPPQAWKSSFLLDFYRWIAVMLLERSVARKCQ